MNFFSLPEGVRRRVYELAGLVRECPIDPFIERYTLDARRRGEVPYSDWVSSPRSERIQLPSYPPLPLTIMRVSKRVYHEARALFYSENTFIARFMLRPGEDPANLLSESFLGALSNFHVVLLCGINPCRHHRLSISLDETRNCQACYARTYWNSNPFDDGEWRDGERTIEQWTILCHRLATAHLSGQLDFSLTCNCYYTGWAKLIVQALQPLRKRTSSATIDFGGPDSSKTSRMILARNTGLRLVQHRPREQKFIRYLDLPLEIQQEIWRHLTTPRDSSVNQDTQRTAPGSVAQVFPDFEIASAFGQPDWLIGHEGYLRIPMRSTASCCGHCFSVPGLCFCHGRRAAYSPTCRCEGFIEPFLLVSRQLRLQAQAILFRQCPLRLEGTPHQALQCLRSVPKAVLALVQCVSLCIGSGDTHYAWDTVWFDQGYHQDWLSLINFLRENLDISNLRLAVNFRCGQTSATYYSFPPGKRSIQLLRMYWHCLSALHTIRGLKGLSIKLEFFRDLEKRFESAILGPGHFSADQAYEPGDRQRSGRGDSRRIPEEWLEKVQREYSQLPEERVRKMLANF